MLYSLSIPPDPLVRALPYPYQAGLSFANDADFFNFDFFETWMKFLNSRGSTPLGEGLGLEISSSLFFFSAHTYSFSYFAGAEASSPLSPQSERLNEYLVSGWIDANHAYGDFDGVGGFSRAHAERTLSLLQELRVSLPVFSNHGDHLNHQNIGVDAAYHRGDIDTDSAYHADLLAPAGTRFVWTDSLNLEKSVYASRWNWRRRLQRPRSSDVLFPWRLQDNSEFWGIRRVRATGAYAPNLSSLSWQLQQLDLDAMYRYGGLAILYQHFGVLAKTAGRCLPAEIDAVRKRPAVFLAPFYRLQREVREGRLWLASLARFLRYVLALRQLKVRVNHTDNLCCFELVGEGLVKDDLAGLTLYCDPNLPVSARFCGQELPLVENGPDHSGRYSVSVPIPALADIWT